MVVWPENDQATLLPQGAVFAISPKWSAPNRPYVLTASEVDLVK